MTDFDKRMADFKVKQAKERVTRDFERMQVKKYCNYYMYSDVHPFEVVKQISAITVEVRGMDSKQTVFPKDFSPGGFVGHFADNHNQDYDYTSNEDYSVMRVRWSKAKRGWYDAHGGRYIMEDKPAKFYDYNF